MPPCFKHTTPEVDWTLVALDMNQYLSLNNALNFSYTSIPSCWWCIILTLTKSKIVFQFHFHLSFGKKEELWPGCPNTQSTLLPKQVSLQKNSNWEKEWILFCSRPYMYGNGVHKNARIWIECRDILYYSLFQTMCHSTLKYVKHFANIQVMFTKDEYWKKYATLPSKLLLDYSRHTNRSIFRLDWCCVLCIKHH